MDKVRKYTLTITGFKDDTAKLLALDFLLPYFNNATKEQLLSALNGDRFTISKNLKKETADKLKVKLESLGAKLEISEKSALKTAPVIQKIPCFECGAIVLHATAIKTGGSCMACRTKGRAIYFYMMKRVKRFLKIKRNKRRS